MQDDGDIFRPDWIPESENCAQSNTFIASHLVAPSLFPQERSLFTTPQIIRGTDVFKIKLHWVTMIDSFGRISSNHRRASFPPLHGYPLVFLLFHSGWLPASSLNQITECFLLPLLCSQCGSFHHICSLIITRRATIYVNNAPFKRQAEFIFNHLYVFKKRKYVLHHLITFIPAKDWTLEAARSSGRVQLYCCVSVNATTLGQFSASFLRPDRRQVQK